MLLMPLMGMGQSYTGHRLQTDRLSISLTDGVMDVIPLSDKAVRIQWHKGQLREERELIFTENVSHPVFKVDETGSKLVLRLKDMSVFFDKKSGAIDYRDAGGKIFLSEKAGGRKLTESSVAGEPCLVAEQRFNSPAGEHLFGLGQFQDGQFNLRNISRKLIQVNSQIAIPFLYSSKGYGILWHQYGLTYFNPADNIVPLEKQSSATGENKEVEVTTTSGTQRVSQQQSLYTGKFKVERDGEYSFMLDLGDMASRHLLIIDGVSCIDQSNLWLPPAAGMLTRLKAGEHTVQVVCRASNKPVLSWNMAENETTFRSPNARALDYVVFHGKNADEVIAAYRNLSGNVPMLPLWAYGFWQCRERYTSGKHLVSTVEEFRKRKLPVDVIVQDWQYWGKHGWGVPQFDTANYPNPAGFIRQLHDLNARFSISVWENLDKKSEVAKDYISANLYIPNSPWIDIFNPATQKTHWNALDKNLFSLGVDSWWMDATEPENDALAGKQTWFGTGEFYRLTYPLFVSKAVYEGQRATNDQKRVTILTRSAFAGQQRFGTINWSGDIGWNWDTFRRQIKAGLNFSLTGMPFWTTDIGGFFRPGATQYTDEKYHEILTRWFQWGAFNPVFRIHGYQTETEPWKYGEKVESDMRKMLNLRYRLLPYIYSEGWQVSSKGSTMMRPLVMDFSEDSRALAQPYEYMFGRAFLVAPVTEAGIKESSVYLPGGNDWYDFWTGSRLKGGQTVKANTPADQIPLFVKAGSILPLGKVTQYATVKAMDSLEIRVYRGANGKFTLYADEGDNYNYEKGKYRLIPFTWNEQKNTLTIDAMKGDYPGAPGRYVFDVVWVSPSAGKGDSFPVRKERVIYNGARIQVKRN
ncbi:glycosyl hydrolase family 31 [Pararcticibacter amylolyticus]|uniref:Glycosyl hydrolase family 31 n=2 Tax=Pararcticibacter amylolyticus TaxID=2173175 RepID=A0A2U2PIY0_9SPHI|nr:glycosyl hydrolase family 31 [Pararcticibacter amylolyticus]